MSDIGGGGSVRWGAVFGTIVALVVGFLLFGMFTATAKIPQDSIGLTYGGGPFEGQHFQDIVEPGTGRFVKGMFDKLYLYPVTQRNYIVSTRANEGDVEGADAITAPSSDRVPVTFEIATYFKLNLEKIRTFHENIGLKYRAWEHDGWNEMLNDSFRQQIEFALQRESRKHTVAELYASEQVLQDMQISIGQILKEEIEEVLGDEYFCGPTYEQGGACTDFTFVIKNVVIPDGLREQFQAIQESFAQISVRENEVQQRRLEADAIRELNAALEEAGQNYVLLRAIEEGSIEIMVVPSDIGLTLPTPAGRSEE
jgi:hypothetical protein